jgi:hypothetical protein
MLVCQLYLLHAGALSFSSRIVYMHPRDYTSPWAAPPVAVPLLKHCYWLSVMQVIFDNSEV